MRLPVLSLSLLFALVGCLQPEAGHESQQLTGPIASCPIPAGPEQIPGHEADFYWCADSFANSGDGCGASGYPRGYGARYAQRFYRETRPRMTARGQAWIDDVLICLQLELRERIDVQTSCSDLRRIAFDSHPGCYIEAGFCTLHPWDVLNVVWTVDATDWLSADAARQLVHTALGCGHQYTRALWWFFGHLM